jgi:hypothetical protein
MISIVKDVPRLSAIGPESVARNMLSGLRRQKLVIRHRATGR